MNNNKKNNNFTFHFNLYETKSGEQLATNKIVSGKDLKVVLEQVTEIVKSFGGPKVVSLRINKARINENTIVIDPTKIESLNTIMTLATEHYDQVGSKKTKKLTEQQSSVKNLKSILSNPKKVKKLIKELELPNLEIGDQLLVGKFKNRRAIIKGFETDEHGQPIAKTTKGDQPIFKGRVAKLIPSSKPVETTDNPQK